MKIARFLVFTILCLLGAGAGKAQAQLHFCASTNTWISGPCPTGALPIVTVATLPAASSVLSGTVYSVTDSSTGCTVGGGTAKTLCISDGISTWTAVAGGSVGPGTVGTLPLFSPSTTALANSLETEANSTFVSAEPNGVNAAQLVTGGSLPQMINSNIPNDGTTGTTALLLAKINSSGNAIKALTTDTNVQVFPVVASISSNGVVQCAPGTTGNACLVLSGEATLTFDAGGGTAGHYAGESTVTAGTAIDLGTTVPAGVICVGQILATVAASANGTVVLNSCPGQSFGSTSAVNGVNYPASPGTNTVPVVTASNTVTYEKVPPIAGGVGAMTSAPPWLRYFGDGSDGAVNQSGASSTFQGIHQYTTFTCSAILSNNSAGPTIIYATTSITLNTGCVINVSADPSSGGGAGNLSTGDIGGGGGGSGGGAAAGTAGNAANIPSRQTFITPGAAGTAGAITGGNGGNGAQPSALNQKSFTIQPPYSVNTLVGGAAGSAGANSGGAAGKGGGVLILVAPNITFASGITLDVGGTPGACSVANSTGAGSGAGGGVIFISTESLTDSGALLDATGGLGGCNANPQVFLCVPGVVVNGFGTCPGSVPALTPVWTTPGVAHVSAFTTGNPTAITVDTAGAGYNYTPGCLLIGTGGGANTGSGATCTVTMSAGAIASIAVSGGNAGYGTGTTYTTSGLGGYGGQGFVAERTIQ